MNLRLVLHTVSHLRMRQIVYQIWYRIFKPAYRPMLYKGEVNKMQLVEFVSKPFSWDGRHFCFLNLTSSFASWNDVSHGMLWAYNLNYMDWLLQPGMDYVEGEEWIERFSKDLPRNRIGMDPYPIALRGINWIKFIVHFYHRIPQTRLKSWNDTLYAQYCLLERKLEYHLLGNHLLEDAYSLYIASLYFQDKRWYVKSSHLLRHELNEQVLPDGAHYEQSPMYHCILLDRLLDCYNFSVHNSIFEGQEDMNGFLREKAELMLGWLEAVVYEDGSIPLLNDAAYGIAPMPNEIFGYAKRLGILWRKMDLTESGYRKLHLGWGEAIVDVGEIKAVYQPGHSHADALSYELCIAGCPFIVDTGISTYDKTERRQWERGTAAHNTVVISGKNSDEVWSGFRVGWHAKVRVLEEKENSITALCEGFVRGNLHRRSFQWGEEAFVITDFVGQNVRGVSYIHLAPDVVILSRDAGRIETKQAMLEIDGADRVEVYHDFVSQEYNRLLPSEVIAIYFSETVKYSIRIR